MPKIGDTWGDTCSGKLFFFLVFLMILLSLTVIVVFFFLQALKHHPCKVASKQRHFPVSQNPQAAVKCVEELVHCKDDFFVLTFIVHKLHLYFVRAIILLISGHIKLMDFVCIHRIIAWIDITFSLGVSLVDDTQSIIH